MKGKLYVLNILFAIVDTLVCLVAISGFAFAAWYFEKWWILLFTLIPLLLFNSHTLVIEAGIDSAKETEEDNDG